MNNKDKIIHHVLYGTRGRNEDCTEVKEGM